MTASGILAIVAGVLLLVLETEEVNMSVRAKFKVDSIEKVEGGSTVKLSPVTGGSPENDEFYHATPAGQITLMTVNASAAKQFESAGSTPKQFYVEFTAAD